MRRSDNRSDQSSPAKSADNCSQALHGLALPRPVLQGLEKRGIYCLPVVSLEHQHLARRYVLRGVESGGAVEDMGRACAFVAEDGQPLEWLNTVDSITVNGRHAIFIASTMARIEMCRIGRTYELVVSLHSISERPPGKRPTITSRTLFRARDGSLPVDLWRQEHRRLRGLVAPTFYSRAGEEMKLPERFEAAIRAITSAVCCIGCKHTHVGAAPGREPIA